MTSRLTESIDIGELFQQDRFAQIEAALERGDTHGVRRLAAAVRTEYVPVHDGFRDAIALSLSYLARTRGPHVGEHIGRLCVEKLMGDGDPPQYSQSDLLERIKAIAAGWHWHATRFTLSEDDEKVTFLLHPCGSGMRLIQNGNYQSGPFGPQDAGSDTGSLTRSEGGSWSTFMSDGFPIYCNHCSEMNHMALANGSSTFLVEGWTPLREQGLCIQHTYKDIALVPDEFYRRADLPVPDSTERPPAPGRQLSREELLSIETHPLDRLVDCAERGDGTQARAALDECLLGWRDSIHDVYRNWLSMLWAQVSESLGDQALAETVRATAPDLFAHVRGGDVLAWAALWSIHLRLRSIAATSDSVEFKVGQEALLEPGALPHDASWFAEQLNAGLTDRDWSDVGRFAVDDDVFLHTLPRT